ncbi:hypothetical protein BHE74_00031289 [Ensete ventricosum]|nr:hypothetical protein BHE74_00031289 [Ensete ventricosum]RZS08693.1 hypothetical protein BHM03_00039703 [Ensete ventricosum]
MAKQQQQYREMAVPRDAAGGRRSLIPFRRYIAEQRGNIRRQSTVRMVFFGIWMRLVDRDRLQRVRNHTSHLDLGTVERRREKKKKAARERNHKDWWSQR